MVHSRIGSQKPIDLSIDCNKAPSSHGQAQSPLQGEMCMLERSIIKIFIFNYSAEKIFNQRKFTLERINIM